MYSLAMCILFSVSSLHLLFDFKLIVYITGGPGSGKGTQCTRIVEKFGLVHLSTGDLLRAEVKKESEQGQAIANIMKEGGLVSAVS